MTSSRAAIPAPLRTTIDAPFAIRDSPHPPTATGPPSHAARAVKRDSGDDAALAVLAKLPVHEHVEALADFHLLPCDFAVLQTELKLHELIERIDATSKEWGKITTDFVFSLRDAPPHL